MASTLPEGESHLKVFLKIVILYLSEYDSAALRDSEKNREAGCQTADGETGRKLKLEHFLS
jgi:hypothetical protein